MRMNKDKVLEYCTKELRVSPEEAERLFKKVSKYEDIYSEFLSWIDNRKYTNGIIVEDYSSEQIHELAPSLSGIGVYNFMVTLRDNPELAREIIQSGFKTQ